MRVVIVKGVCTYRKEGNACYVDKVKVQCCDNWKFVRFNSLNEY